MNIYLVETERYGCYVVVAKDEQQARSIFDRAMFPIPYMNPTFELHTPADGNKDDGLVIHVTEGAEVMYP